MILLWSSVSAAMIIALLAWRQARRTSQRLTQLTEMYWELRYQHGDLRLRMQRMTGEAPPASPEPPTSGQAGESFVPLSSLKR